MRYFLVIALCILVANASGLAQNGSSVSGVEKTARTSVVKTEAAPYRNAIYSAGIFCGMGGSLSANKAAMGGNCGLGFSLIPQLTWEEAGVMGLSRQRAVYSSYLTSDLTLPLIFDTAHSGYQTHKVIPYAFAGYTRLFELGHAMDYGGGADIGLRQKNEDDYKKSLRVEVRDYWIYSNPSQHNPTIRVGMVVWIPD